MDSTTAPLFEHLNVLEHMELFARLRYGSDTVGGYDWNTESIYRYDTVNLVVRHCRKIRDQGQLD